MRLRRISPKKEIAISGITAVNKVYDGNTAATLTMPTITTEMGLVGEDELTVTASGTFEDKNAGVDKAVVIHNLTLDGADIQNYGLAKSGQQQNTTASIGKKVITVTADAKEKARGEADPELTYISTDMLAGDALSGALSRVAGEAVGTYPILISTLANENYNINYIGRHLTIKKNQADLPPAVPTGVITGTATGSFDKITVKLVYGNKVLNSQICEDGDTYTFNNLADGYYNLIITDGATTKTIPVELKDGVTNPASTDIDLGNKIVEVIVEGDETPNVVVADNLESQIENNESIKVTIEKTEAPSDITQAAKNKIVSLNLNIVVEKNSLEIDSLSSVIRIIVPIPDEAKGRSITVYRTHNGETKALAVGENKAIDGEYIEIGTDYITMFVKNFSDYAITYVKPSTSSGGSSSGGITYYTLNYTAGEGGSITGTKKQSVAKNANGTEVIAVANEGFEFIEWSDGVKTASRIDKGITTSINVIAKFKAKEEEPAPNEWQNPFTDVSKQDWFYDAVRFANENELMNGISNTIFGPNVDVTRGAYYEKAVAWAHENGIVKGITDTQFMPDSIITREQMAAIIYRYETFKGNGPVGDWAIKLDYTDLEKVSDYAGEAIMFCKLKDIMGGNADGTFAPKSNATRAQAAAVLMRVLLDLK